MTSKVTEILGEVLLELQSIAAFTEYSIHVLSEDDFFNKIAQVGGGQPAVGIMFEGLRSRSEADKPSHKVGLSCDLNISLILAVQSQANWGGDLRGTAIEHLDSLRNKLKDSKSKVGGHSWRFIAETPAWEKGKSVLWMQRWSTVVQMT